MKLFSKLFAAIAVVALVSCSSDGPGSEQNKYNNLVPYSMDIMGAKSLIVSNGGTRADDLGKFQEMGLYKVDAAGNISAVGVFMTTDENGEKLENQVEMKFIPESIQFSSESFIVFGGGSFVAGKLSDTDVDGNGRLDDYSTRVWEDHVIFVNRNTGKIYRTDIENWEGYYTKWVQTDSNTLYKVYQMANGYSLTKFSFNGNKLTSTLIGENAVSDNFLCLTSNNVYVSGDVYQAGLVWPNGGYDYINAESLGFDPIIVPMENKSSIGTFKIEDLGQYSPDEIGWIFIRGISYYDINIGSVPGDVKLDFKAETKLYLAIDEANSLGRYGMSTYGTNDKALFWSGIGLLVYDRISNEIYLRHTEFDDKNFVFGLDHQFDGRQWTVVSTGSAKKYVALWINPSTLESGSFDIDLAGIDVSEVQESYTAGQIVFKGTRRADSASVIATLNLATQKTDILFSSFNQISIDYYPLN